ncbi:MAG TPA: hypothetical protein VFU86_18865 [Terriglobales bacterium]|nr:hypothetical protein [Terriglobales bacterium]
MAPLRYRLKDHVGIDSSGYNCSEEDEEKHEPDDPQLKYAANERDLQYETEHRL